MIAVLVYEYVHLVEETAQWEHLIRGFFPSPKYKSVGHLYPDELLTTGRTCTDMSPDPT